MIGTNGAERTQKSDPQPLTQAQRFVLEHLLSSAQVKDWREVVRVDADARNILRALLHGGSTSSALQICTALAQGHEHLQQYPSAKHWLERRLEISKGTEDGVAALEQLNRVQECMARQSSAIASHSRDPYTPVMSPSPAATPSATPVRSTPMTSADASPDIMSRDSPNTNKRIWGDSSTLALSRPAGFGLQANSSGEQ